MREIKVKYWDKYNKAMSEPMTMRELLWEACECNLGYHDDLEFLQYTGVKDENGTEIYEGDIYNLFGFIGEIKFEQGEYIITDGKRIDSLGYETCSLKDSSVKGVVIGNIYENPELLEEEQ